MTEYSIEEHKWEIKGIPDEDGILFKMYLSDIGEIGRARVVKIFNDTRQQYYALLEDLILEEEYRGIGFGYMFVKQIIQEVEKEGCYKFIATSRFGRDMIHKFYMDLGFKEWGYEFRIDL